ncbi:MAG: hypothetical protein FJX76_24850 [Armatimonadetes bacterium]|nr:hypothetical protein [Armatimonadota bacterium]
MIRPASAALAAIRRAAAAIALVAAVLALLTGNAYAQATPKPEPTATSAKATPPAGKATGKLGTTPKPRHKALPEVITLGAAFNSTDLPRIFVGNQAGLLKVYDRDRRTVLFIKDIPNVSMQGIDSTNYAPISDAHRTAIFAALSLGSAELETVADNIVNNFDRLQGKREAIALLGVIGSEGAVPGEARVRVRRFLEVVTSTNKDVVLQRQAVLALAVQREIDATTVEAVTVFVEANVNAWQTFTTKQFFEYHAAFLKSMSNGADLRARIAASRNPYAEEISTRF